MSRDVTAMGPVMPVVPLMPVVKSNYTYNAALPRNGVDTAFWAGEQFPWNYYMSFRSANAGELEVQVPHNDGNGYDTVARLSKPTGEQTIINGESHYYVSEYERFLVTPNLPQLSFINAAGNHEYVAMRTPANFKDMATGVINDFEIASVNQAGSEITVHGKEYTWGEPSETQPGIYAMGAKRVGLDRFSRDELTGDTNHGQSWKKQTYAYGFIIVKIPGKPNQKVRYDSVNDGATTDPTAGNATTRTLHLLDALTDWPSAGDNMQLLRHMPYISAMDTTQYTFSQHGGASHFRVKIPDHKRQFFAMFDWSQYIEVPAKGALTAVQFAERDKSAEADKIEYLSGPSRRFHNLHSPTGGMLNAAALENRTPVISHPEWTKNTQQQHQIQVPVGDPQNIVYGDQWVEIWTYHWLEGNPAGKPANSYEWYGKCPDGVFRRLGGCICPDHWADGILDPKQIFINNATYGNFARSMDFIFDVGGGSALDTDQWSIEIDFFDVYQLPNQIAGGMGVPARNGTYPNGFAPSPATTTDVSGTGMGVVNADATGFVTGTSTVQDFDNTVRVVLDEIPIIHSRAGSRHPLSHTITRNTLGYGINVVYYTSIPGASIENDELVFSANLSGDFVDDVWLEYTEASGPGTAPIVGGAVVVTPDDNTVPDPDDSGDGGLGDGGDGGTSNFSITVTSTGPTVVATTNLPEGRQGRISLANHPDLILTGTVTNGTITITGIPDEYDGVPLRIFATAGADFNEAEATGGQFVYTKTIPPLSFEVEVSGSGVQPLSFEVEVS